MGYFVFKIELQCEERLLLCVSRLTTPNRGLVAVNVKMKVQDILHSSEEDNLSPFDLKIACLCQSIEINKNINACMYMCMYVCMHACIYIYIYVSMCVSMYVCYWVQVFLVWSSITQSVCKRPFGLLEIRFQRPWVRILHSAEEDNLSPFDSISLHTNKHVYMYDSLFLSMSSIHSSIIHPPSIHLSTH